MSISYGQVIEWVDRDGTRTRICVKGRSSAREAFEDAVTAAKDMGWKPPKWWQFWRWGEPVRRDTFNG